MFELVVGVAQVSLLLRHARSLKDKRQVLTSLKQKLRNQGFSVVESAHADSAKQASLGFAYVGTGAAGVEKALDEGLKLFVGNGEILSTHRQLFDYSDQEEQLDWDPDEYESRE